MEKMDYAVLYAEVTLRLLKHHMNRRNNSSWRQLPHMKLVNIRYLRKAPFKIFLQSGNIDVVRYSEQKNVSCFLSYSKYENFMLNTYLVETPHDLRRSEIIVIRNCKH